MKRPVLLCALTLMLPGGCPLQPRAQLIQPQGPSEGFSPVNAHIAISSTRGSAPLRVQVSAAESFSLFGGPLEYLWDFGGELAAETVTATHTFNNPGLYEITLQVRDPGGLEDVARVQVQVAGGAVEAVIKADTNSGPVPLVVRFDGSDSYAADDVIRDYLWDFGDRGERSRQAAPVHVYEHAGEYTVTLTVRTSGGLEAAATTTISAGGQRGSLQFDGGQFATLPLGGEAGESGFTCEGWFKASMAGGALVSIGNGALVLEIRPADNTIRAAVGGEQHEAAASNLVGLWRHVAVTYDAGAGSSAEAEEDSQADSDEEGESAGETDSDGGADSDGGTEADSDVEADAETHGTVPGNVTLYLDGAALRSAAVSSALSVSELTVGMGFVGKVAELRFWSLPRDGAQIAGNYDRRLPGAATGLLGYWPLDRGSGQSLANQAAGGLSGTRGASTAAEISDPAWSTDAPSLK